MRVRVSYMYLRDAVMRERIQITVPFTRSARLTQALVRQVRDRANCKSWHSVAGRVKYIYGI